MTDAVKTQTMDVDACYKFLNWMHDKQDAKSQEHLATILSEMKETPIKVFITGLKLCSEKVEELEKNPLSGLLLRNPAALFDKGLNSGFLLGIAMGMASTSTEFSELLQDLTLKPKNVTPISSAKGFAK